MKRLVRKHPLAIRWFHWINFPILFLMLWSGLMIYWAHDVYRLAFGARTLFRFFPEVFYEKLSLDHHLAQGMAWHFLFAWVFAINGVLYVLYTIFSGAWRELLPNRHAVRDAMLVTLHDLHLIKRAPAAGKYNAAQQIAYTLIVLMGAGSLLTGLAMYKPVQFRWLATLLGGDPMARWEHFWLTVGYVVFFVVHIVQVIKTGWNNFQSMVTGYEIATAPALPQPDGSR